MGLALDWPSAAYEEVMESMTDWAFSWPISVHAWFSQAVLRCGLPCSGA